MKKADRSLRSRSVNRSVASLPRGRYFDRLFHDLDLLVGQPVQFVDDLVDQIVGALDLSLQFLCPRFRLQIALQPLPNVPDGGQCQLSKSIDERVGLRRRLPELGEAAGLLDGDGDEVFG
jgi:hypothetical protein